MARAVRSRHDVEYDDDALGMTLAEVFPLPAKRKLFYWFDFGDDWKFSVSRTRAAARVPVKGAKYPRLVATEGERPEQYPSW